MPTDPNDWPHPWPSVAVANHDVPYRLRAKSLSGTGFESTTPLRDASRATKSFSHGIPHTRRQNSVTTRFARPGSCAATSIMWFMFCGRSSTTLI
jgi:hypothetical protein